MKKLISVALVLVLALALSVSAFAATNYSHDQLTGMINGNNIATASQKALALQVVNEMTDAQIAAVDADIIKAQAEGVRTKVNAGTLSAADVDAAIKAINAALGSDVKVALSDLAIDTAKGTVTAKVTATIGGKAVVTNASVAGDWKVNSSSTTTTPVTTGVIKSTGSNLQTAATVVALAVVGVLGVATVKARKLEMGA